MPKFIEMDQLKDKGGSVVVSDTRVVPPADADQLLSAWTADAEVMRRQPGFVSTRLHRGIGEITVFLHDAI